MSDKVSAADLRVELAAREEHGDGAGFHAKVYRELLTYRRIGTPDAISALVELCHMQAKSHHADCDHADVHIEGQDCSCGSSKLAARLAALGLRPED